MSHSIITYPDVPGQIETSGTRVISATTGLSWAHDRSLAGIWIEAHRRGYDIQKFVINDIA